MAQHRGAASAIDVCVCSWLLLVAHRPPLLALPGCCCTHDDRHAVDDDADDPRLSAPLHAHAQVRLALHINELESLPSEIGNLTNLVAL
jgi:hypothetical protein